MAPLLSILRTQLSPRLLSHSQKATSKVLHLCLRPQQRRPWLSHQGMPSHDRCQLWWVAGMSWQCNHHHHLSQGYHCHPHCLQQSCRHCVQSWHCYSHHPCHQACHHQFQHWRQFQLYQACFHHCQYHCRRLHHHHQFPHPCCRHCHVCHYWYRYHQPHRYKIAGLQLRQTQLMILHHPTSCRGLFGA